MSFNISCDVAALAFLLIILWKFFSQRQFPTLSNKIFGIILTLAVADVSLDILGVLSLRRMIPGHLWLPYLVNYMYFVVHMATPSALTAYILALVGHTSRNSVKLHLSFCVPAMICELILLLSIPFGWVFSITIESGYTKGPLWFITYLCAAIYMSASLVLTHFYRKKFTDNERQSVILLVLFVIFASILQINMPNMLFTGVALAAALMIMYFTVQDPARMIDGVTGLFNYQAFLSFLNSSFISGREFHMAAVNLHGLRRVNTVFGNEQGDAVLRRVGGFLSDHEDTWTFRISNVRFVAVTENDKSYEELVRDIKQNRVMNWSTAKGFALLSLNACLIDHAGRLCDTANAINTIDKALLRHSDANHLGHVVDLDDETLNLIRRESDVENALRESIPKGQGFELYYQPIFSTETGKCDSVEALLRYSHPQMGMVSPDEFITIGENTGQAVAIDEMVIKKAFKRMADSNFRKLGLDHVQINLSAASFADPDMADNIIHIAGAYGINPKSVIFEITETTAVVSTEMVRAVMTSLNAAGFRFALDDFGTGYGNITRVLELPFSMVKIDRSLLYGSKGVFESVARMFEGLNVTTVVEGVETTEQDDFVKKNGIKRIQGFKYARPMTTEQLYEFYKKPSLL